MEIRYKNIRPEISEGYNSLMPEWAMKLGYSLNEVTFNGWNWTYWTWMRLSERIEAGLKGNPFCTKCGDLQMIPFITYQEDLQRWNICVKRCECVTKK